MPPHTSRKIGSSDTPKPRLRLVERTSVMRHPFLMLHLLGMQLNDQLRQALDARTEDPERGSVTIE